MNVEQVEAIAQLVRTLSEEERAPLMEKLQRDRPSGQSRLKRSTAADLLQVAGTWAGDDLEACLQQVYETRSPTEPQMSILDANSDRANRSDRPRATHPASDRLSTNRQLDFLSKLRGLG